MTRLPLILITLGAGGCAAAPAYYYAPETAAVNRAGMPTRIEQVPQESPRGTVEVASGGITQGQRGERALHVRLTVDNEGDDRPWTVDIRDQAVEIAGVGRSQPQSANAGVESLPTITVARRERRDIDLYYPVPPNMADAAHLPSFDVLWQVTTPERTVAGRTRVDRREIVARAPEVYVSGWGPYWWYDPWYPRVLYRPIFVHPIARAHRH